MKIEWAPWNIPLQRRLQTFSTGFFAYIFFGLPLASPVIVAVFLYYGSILTRVLVLIYLTYVYFDHKWYNSEVPSNKYLFLRNNRFNKLYRSYFPVDLVKTAELPPNKNYILACFPHGVLGTGVCINMGLDIEKWLKFFPKVHPKIATLNQHFYTPILREIIRLWGFISVSKESLTYYLQQTKDQKNNKDDFTCNAVAILVGGAQESLDTYPGKYILTLKNRKGFVKLAIKTGSDIVPSFSFGEVDIFRQVNNPPNSKLRRFQNKFKKLTGISPLLIVGRGFFNYTFGLLPHRRRIVQVVGKPIDVVKCDEPDPKYVDEIHAKVIQALEMMFEEYKHEYIENASNINLVIH